LNDTPGPRAAILSRGLAALRVAGAGAVRIANDRPFLNQVGGCATRAPTLFTAPGTVLQRAHFARRESIPAQAQVLE